MSLLHAQDLRLVLALPLMPSHSGVAAVLSFRLQASSALLASVVGTSFDASVSSCQLSRGRVCKYVTSCLRRVCKEIEGSPNFAIHPATAGREAVRRGARRGELRKVRNRGKTQSVDGKIF